MNTMRHLATLIVTVTFVALLIAFVALAQRGADPHTASVVAPSPAPPPASAASSPVILPGGSLLAKAPSAEPSNSSPSIEVEEPTPRPSICTEQYAIGEDQSIADTAYWAKIVFIGRVTEVGPAGWSDSQGGPAGNTMAPGPSYIETPLTFSVETPIRGTAAGATQETAVGGGIVGCVRFTMSGVPEDFVPGQRFAIFLIDPDILPVTRGLVGIWPVTGETVATPLDGVVSIDELAQQVAKAGYAPFPAGGR